MIMSITGHKTYVIGELQQVVNKLFSVETMKQTPIEIRRKICVQRGGILKLIEDITKESEEV